MATEGETIHPSYALDKDYAAMLAQFEEYDDFVPANGERMGVVSDYLRDRGFESHADGWQWLRKWQKWPFGMKPQSGPTVWAWASGPLWKEKDHMLPMNAVAFDDRTLSQTWSRLRDALHVAVCWYAETMADLNPR